MRIPIIPRSPAGRLRMILVLAIFGGGIAFCYFTMISMPGQSHRGALPRLTPVEVELRDRLVRHVAVLADEIGIRALPGPNLDRAMRYVDAAFAEAGYSTARLPFAVDRHTIHNVEAILGGSDADAGIVVVGAHYDSWAGTPGANDNASGTASLLEIARILRDRRFRRSIHFVGFANEEPPWFATSNMGSHHYVGTLQQRGTHVSAMLSLETVGYYDERPGSQRYPYPLSAVFPDTGDFIAFVGDFGSRALVRRVIGSFRSHTAFPSEGLAAPASFQGVGWSDHRSFWAAGWPGIMVTDTALFRDDAYHQPSDKPGRLDYSRLARVVAGVARVVESLAEPIEPR